MNAEAHKLAKLMQILHTTYRKHKAVNIATVLHIALASIKHQDYDRCDVVEPSAISVTRHYAPSLLRLTGKQMSSRLNGKCRSAISN